MFELEILVALAPLLLLLGSLLLGRYPGCEAAVRLGARLAAWTRAALVAPPAPRLLRVERRHAPRGGLILAFGLSGRAPPA
jgi:hypothetical protein